MAKHFIQSSIKRPGALTRKAKRAHMGVQAFAHRHAHDKTLTGREARFAIELKNFRKK